MAKKKKLTSKPKRVKKKNNSIVAFFKSKQTHLAFGVFIFTSAIFLLISFYSFLIHWKEDQSLLGEFTDKTYEAKNLLGKLGAKLSHLFVYDGFGIATFIFPILLFLIGLYIIINIPIKQLNKAWFNGILVMIWLSIGFAFLKPETPLLAGKVGYEINEFSQIYVGKTGVFLLLLISLLIFIISKFKITPEKVKNILPKSKEKSQANNVLDDITGKGFITEAIHENETAELELNVEASIIDKPKEMPLETVNEIIEETQEEEIEIVVEKPIHEEHIVENLSNNLVKDFGEFDPKLELSKYQFPELNLLRDYTNESIQINKAELETNKNKIVETLNNYKIGISSIKATIGPTVTLYEIVPNAGVRISKIKNLEDD
ncbi:MAG: DNA translocase FtsK 4TM domain-containing protein, partial [Flavobacteriaceae bacterium]|nr:DNA translocase FtsK 4TM domain-containing protein [Flavobacteriaceae bacterium]